MKTNNISIATITWVRNEHEERVVRNALEQLAALGMPVFLTDGGSTPRFLHFLRGFSNFNVTEGATRGVHEQAKQSLIAAYDNNHPFVLYTEPDKESFFRTGLSLMLNNITADQSTGIYLAARSAAGFSTFPHFQQMTETTINKCCGEVTGVRLDYTYGPFVINRNLIPYLNLVKEDLGWGWRPFIFNLAHRLGYRIEAFTEYFSCQPDARQDDATERIYRMLQLKENINGIIVSTKIELEPRN